MKEPDYQGTGVYVLGVEIAADFSRYTPEQVEKMVRLLERQYVNEWRTGFKNP